MDSTEVVCPVCTLYLRPGITLKAHLASHPKQKVIDALVNLTIIRNENKEVVVSNHQYEEPSSSRTNNRSWTQPVTGFPAMAGNHSFIYQQFMTTSQQPATVNALGQQYMIPAVFNPQMMCQPYMYQQQQVIMSAGTTMVAVPPQFMRKPHMFNICEDQGMAICSSTQNLAALNNNVHPVRIQTASQRLRQISREVDSDVVIIGDPLPPLRSELEVIEIPKTPTPPLKEDDLKEDKKEDLDEKKEEEIEVESQPASNFVEPDPPPRIGSPMGSPATLDYLRVRTDLNKSCQTPEVAHINNPEDIHVPDSENNDDPSFYNVRNQTPTGRAAEVIPLQGPFEHTPVDFPPTNITIQPTNDQVIDMDGMQLVLCNDFMGSQLISQVEDFECMNNRSERTILMNIGGMDGGTPNTFTESNINMDHIDHLADESISQHSANMSIHADERMPPRGELSGQESNGAASDITWNRIHYDGNSATSTCYDLFARETWEGSDCSDTDATPLPNRTTSCEPYDPDLDDTPTIISVTEAPLNFKCPVCGQGFMTHKERKAHQTEMHSDKNNKTQTENDNAKASNNVIGSRVGNKRGVKKLVIKPRKSDVKSENNFDNVFTNKLKLDSSTEAEENKRASVIAAVSTECDLDEKKDVRYYVCSICEAILPDNKALKKHKLDQHGKEQGNRFKCETCGEDSKNENCYNDHLKMHPLECRVCGKYFYRRQNLQLHMKRHLGIKPHVCDFCKKCFLTKQKLDEHKNVHTGDAPIKCSMCDETFRRHSNLVQHRNRHHFNIKRKVKDYICFCGEILHSKKKLAWHKEIHDLKPKACTQCNEKFVHMASLTRHMRRAHNERFVPKEERVNENVECPICKGVYLKSSLEVHIRTHSGTRPYTCLICNKDFTTKWNLKLHKWTHAARASKPYKCEQCKSAFIRESDLIAHMNSHKSVKPYTCNHCGAQFIRKYNCQRHVREHEKDKTFSCQICGKTFHRSYYLKDHMRVHSGLRPFSCHICGKTSTTKSNHNKHVMIHHAKEPVSTEN